MIFICKCNYCKDAKRRKHSSNAKNRISRMLKRAEKQNPDKSHSHNWA